MRSKGFSFIETIMFIVLAALVIPIFYLTTQPVIKDMMTPVSWIKARFVAERKMEELMGYYYTATTLTVGNYGPSAVTGDTFYPTDYNGYQWQWAITYLDCNDAINHCVGYTGASLITTSSVTNYKQIDVTVTGPMGVSYRTSSVVTARY